MNHKMHDDIDGMMDDDGMNSVAAAAMNSFYSAKSVCFPFFFFLKFCIASGAGKWIGRSLSDNWIGLSLS
jgi:hypothetical protein